MNKLKDLLWKIFGNDENPEPPDWFMSGKPLWFRKVMWYARNPAHNFFWHVIGFKDKPLDYTQIWNTKQKWNLVLPFFSYRGNKWEFYMGWRPDSRAFGIALRKRKDAKT